MQRLVNYKLVSYKNTYFIYSIISNNIYPFENKLVPLIKNGTISDKELSKYENISNKSIVLKSNKIKRDEIIKDKEIKKSLSKELHQIVLCVTENCNLKCSYCPFTENYKGTRNISSSHMSWEIMRKSIDYLHNHSTGLNRVPGIAFYGGEPLIQIELIKKAVKYARRLFKNNVAFVITTNGTLLNLEMINYFVKNKITLLISLDGPHEIHDRYRKNNNNQPTFKKIIDNITLIKNKHPKFYETNIRFSSVLAPPINYIKLINFFDVFNVINMPTQLDDYGLDLSWKKKYNSSNNFKHLASSFEKACHDSKKRLDVHARFAVCMLGSTLMRLQKRFNESNITSHFLLGQCIPGVLKIFIDIRGNMYPCEKVEGNQNVLIGNIDTGVEINKVLYLLDYYWNTVKIQCSKCWIRNLCPSCLASITHGGKIDLNKRKKVCENLKKTLSLVLGFYAYLLHKDSNALKFLQKSFRT